MQEVPSAWAQCVDSHTSTKVTLCLSVCCTLQRPANEQSEVYALQRTSGLLSSCRKDVTDGTTWGFTSGVSQCMAAWLSSLSAVVAEGAEEPFAFPALMLLRVPSTCWLSICCSCDRKQGGT